MENNIYKNKTQNQTTFNTKIEKQGRTSRKTNLRKYKFQWISQIKI